MSKIPLTGPENGPPLTATSYMGTVDGTASQRRDKGTYRREGAPFAS